MSMGIGTRTVTAEVLRVLLPNVLRARGYEVEERDGFICVVRCAKPTSVAEVLGNIFRGVTLVDGEVRYILNNDTVVLKVIGDGECADE